MIPEKLKHDEIKFVLVEKKGKRPFEKGWQKKFIKWDNSVLNKHLNENGNYGVMGGGSMHLVIVDFDDAEVQEKVIGKLPKTFTVKTGSGLLHKYFFSNKSDSYKIFKEDMSTIADIQGEGKQVVGPGSLHPNGKYYELVEDEEIAFMDYDELKDILMVFDKKKYKTIDERKSFDNKQTILTGSVSSDITTDIKNKVSIKSLLEEFGVDTSKNPTNCCFHESKGGKCLGFEDEYAHCFHCEGKWNIFSLVQQYKNCDFKEALEWLCEREGMSDELKDSRKAFAENEGRIITAEVAEKKEQDNKAAKIFGVEGQVEYFIEHQPVFYDRSGMWWMWSHENKRWQMTDDIDILNGIKEDGVDTITNKSKTEIITALKQIGRKKMPKIVTKNWVQFKDKIIDLDTDEIFNSTPEYFMTNPIPWKIGKSDDTPTLDKYFKEWVVADGVQDESYVDTLYEMMAYSCMSKQFLQRLFALVGSGSNGKGVYLSILRKLLGKDNCCSTEMKLIASNNFETSTLYKKQMCEMGEVDAYDMSNTNTIKMLSGENEIRYCFKGKTAFTDTSATTCFISTNSMPVSPDKSKGFYRRWLIVDFPHEFPVGKDIIADIPEKEFENLCNKIIKICKKLLSNNIFTNEGNLEERTKRYEDRSNPLMSFISEHCEEDIKRNTPLLTFTKQLNEYLKSKRLRIKTTKEIKKALIDEGFEINRRVLLFGADTSKVLCVIGIGSNWQ